MAQYPVKLIAPPGGKEIHSTEDSRQQRGAHIEDHLSRFLEEQLDNDVPNIDKLLEIRRG